MERADTEQAIIKLVQTQTFPEDIDSLARHRRRDMYRKTGQ